MTAQVEVKTWISSEAYARLHRAAQHAGTTVAVLVAHEAELKASRIAERPKRRYVRMTAEHRILIAELHRLRYGPSAIAREVNGPSLRAVKQEIARLQSEQG